MHCTQAAVYTSYQYQYSSYNPHLWQGSKCHQKGTPETHGGVPRSWKDPLGLSGGPREKHGPVRENWGHDKAEMEFRRRDWEGGEQR